MSFCRRMMRMSGFDVAMAHAALPTLHREGEKQAAHLNLQNRLKTVLSISVTVKLPTDCTCSIIRRCSVALWQFY